MLAVCSSSSNCDYYSSTPFTLLCGEKNTQFGLNSLPKNSINDLPKGTALKPWTGVPGLPKGIGPAAALWPKDGVDVPAEEAAHNFSKPNRQPRLNQLILLGERNLVVLVQYLKQTI